MSLILVMMACNQTPQNSGKMKPIQIDTSRQNVDEVGEQKTTQMLQYVSFPDGYFINNSVDFTDEYEGFIFENQMDFDKIIGFGKTMENKPINIDFNKNVVVGIAHRPSSEKIDIRVQGVFKTDSELSFRFSSIKGASQTYQSTALYLIYFEKSALIQNKSIKMNGEKVKLVEKF